MFLGGRGGKALRAGTIAGLLVVLPALARAQEDPCEPEPMSYSEIFYRAIGAVLRYIWSPSDEPQPAVVTPEPDSEIKPGPKTVVPPPLPPPRYAPIEMSSCAKKIAGLDLDAVTNVTREAKCKDQHPCTMRRYFDHVAQARGIDPSFYRALKWRESRWRHWDTDGSVRVSPTDDWGVSQINKSSFQANYAEQYDWDQVVEDPFYNVQVGADILKPGGGTFGCLPYAESRLWDHFVIRNFLEPYLEDGMPDKVREDATRLVGLSRQHFHDSLGTFGKDPALAPLLALSYDGQLDLRRLLKEGPEQWQAQVDLDPPGYAPTPRMIHEAAYACYNGGPRFWRRPWYKRTRYKSHVEAFRRDLDLMEKLDDVIWDDDFMTALPNDDWGHDVKALLRGLRACTDRPGVTEE